MDASAAAVLRASDPVLARLIDRLDPIDLERWRTSWAPADRFGLLLRAILGQQISTRAAAAIHGRLTTLIGADAPADGIAGASDDALRAAGLSRNKAAAVRDLADRARDGRLELERLDGLSDDEARAQLTAVRGIGPWTADLFLLGALGREDVLPAGDLRLRQAVRGAYGLDHLPGAAEVEALGEGWRPHRSLATAYLYSWSPASPPP